MCFSCVSVFLILQMQLGIAQNWGGKKKIFFSEFQILEFLSSLIAVHVF